MRTVFEILWSCLFAIFACTWTVQHLNVPPQREDEDSNPGWKGDLKYELKKFWSSAKWMIITILAPEHLITLNTGQLESARKCTKHLAKYAKEDGVPWSLTHSLFANMGGFVVRENTPGCADASLPIHTERSLAKNEGVQIEERSASSEDGIQVSNQMPVDTKDPAHENVEAHTRGSQREKEVIEMREVHRAEVSTKVSDEIRDGTKTLKNENLEAEIPKEPRPRFILADEILALREKRIIRLPYVTREEIMDKGRSDSFARVIAVSQTLWLVIQINCSRKQTPRDFAAD
jgi:hypothetical protein